MPWVCPLTTPRPREIGGGMPRDRGEGWREKCVVLCDFVRFFGTWGRAEGDFGRGIRCSVLFRFVQSAEAEVRSSKSEARSQGEVRRGKEGHLPYPRVLRARDPWSAARFARNRVGG